MVRIKDGGSKGAGVEGGGEGRKGEWLWWEKI
jgi:hypothetical protein